MPAKGCSLKRGGTATSSRCLGIREVMLAVNKMDQVGFAKATFDSILDGYGRFATQIGLAEVVPIPISALKGDNVTGISPNTPWYHGPVLMEQLESVRIDEGPRNRPFRMPVQWVNRPDRSFRGFAGMI